VLIHYISFNYFVNFDFYLLILYRKALFVKKRPFTIFKVQF
jgi:hypothetical protein